MNIFAPKNYVVYIKENNSNTMLSPNISKWDDNSYVYYSSSRASSVSKPSIIGTTGSAYYEYEPKRDLLAQVRNHINGGVISQYDYENDAAGRRVAVSRSGSMMSETRTDYYGYNYRDELISATKNTEDTEYQYSYDDIGNRVSSLDLGTNRTYVANALNQYTQISNLCDSAALSEDFQPQYDLDGNQTLVKTETGVWQVTYNAENRPVSWTRASDGTNIEMLFDRMGRRVEYVERTGPVTNRHHRFVYDGYLCVQRLDALANNLVELSFAWDPTEPVATRPLVLQRSGGYNLFYTHDGNKNVSELVFFQQSNGIAAHYEYAPFGAVAATSRSTPVTAYDFREYNPFRFSSEYAENWNDVIYYNYRFYSIPDGRFIRYEPFGARNGVNLYSYCNNKVIIKFDSLGLKSCSELKDEFNSWYSQEIKRLETLDNDGQSWVDRLKPCPPSLKCKCVSYAYQFPGEMAGAVNEGTRLSFESPDPSEWELNNLGFKIVNALGHYHPGGAYELRTRDPSKYGGNGNQCIYDENGYLMTNIPAAGTADWSSPNSGNIAGHRKNDVAPFDLARKIDLECDGKGEYVIKYYEVRPSK